ncbi:hypothetical protein BGX26_002107 [Mortierella sp. AD094]|nr:hypothetical protein BGX26_002107 [Mortierella sp. AD094]
MSDLHDHETVAALIDWSGLEWTDNGYNFSQNMTSTNCDELHVSGSWKHHQKPANYSEDQVGSQLGPLKYPRKWRTRSSISPTPVSIQPTVTSKGSTRYSFPAIITTSSEYINLSPPMEDERDAANTDATAAKTFSDNTIPLKIWPKHGLDRLARTSEGSVYPTSAGSTNTESSVVTLVPYMIAKLDPQQESINITRAIDHQETIPVASRALADRNKQDDIVAGATNPIEIGVTNYDSSTVLPESSGKSNDSSIGSSGTSNNSSNSSKESEHHNSEASKCQTRIVPRIVVPDGTSINLSTPPTTPRQQHRTFNFSQPSAWSHNLTQILERLGSRNFWNNTPHGQQNGYDQEASQQQYWQNRTSQAHPQHDTQRNSHEEVNTTNSSASDGRGQQNPTADAPRAKEGLQDRMGPLSLPQFGVMGVPLHGYRTESISSDEKDDWLDEDEEETPGAFFSRTRWNYLLCTRKGLTKSFKHSTTTIFGLLIIIAIGMTAAGKFRDRSQVSDYLPTSLAYNIMEAQIIVIKGFDRHQQSKGIVRRYSESHRLPDSGAAFSHTAESWAAAKIPTWTGPIDPHCFHHKCDLEHFGEEYFAFLYIQFNDGHDYYVTTAYYYHYYHDCYHNNYNFTCNFCNILSAPQITAKAPKTTAGI